MDGGIDVHAHILPQTDDGARSWKESREMLVMASEQGVAHIIATPHFSKKQDIGQMREKLRRLNMQGQLMDPPVRFSLGQEIMYSETTVEDLQAGRALSLAGSRYVLVEFMPEASAALIQQAVRRLLQSGYLPVLAHAERYSCLYPEGRLADMIRSGAYIQMNYSSLKRGMFDSLGRWCRKQVSLGNVHFLGTDMHHPDVRAPRIRGAERWLRLCGGEKLVRRLTAENPRYILEDRMLEL